MNILPGTQLLLTPGGVNRRPVLNTYPGAHLSPASGLLGNSLGPGHRKPSHHFPLLGQLPLNPSAHP